MSSLTDGKQRDELYNMKQKIATMQEENSKLFIQNTKLMTELESTTYKFQNCQTQVCGLLKNIH